MHAAAAQSNLDAATTMGSAQAELQNTIELHATAYLDAKKKNDFAEYWREFYEENHQRQIWEILATNH